MKLAIPWDFLLSGGGWYRIVTQLMVCIAIVTGNAKEKCEVLLSRKFFPKEID